MTKRLYFGNLSWDIDDDQLANVVSQHGKVVSASVISDRDTGRSRGFGFVEVEDTDAQKIIDAMNGQDLNGRALTVNEANDRPERGSGGGGGSRGGYGGGGGGGGGGSRGGYSSNRRY